MTDNDERLKILGDLEHGRISAEEGLRMLQALEPVPGEQEAGNGSGPTEVPLEAGYSSLPLPSDLRRWQSLWRIPFWVGVGLVVVGALLLYQAMQGSGFGLLFFLAGLPFASGVLLMVSGWWARKVRWLHLRIRQRPGRSPENLSFSFPLPLGLTARIVRRFVDRVRPGQGVVLSEMIRSLEKNASPEHPFTLEVGDDRTGDKVRIYIG